MAKDDVEDFIEKMGLAKGNYYIILQDVGDDKFKMMAYDTTGKEHKKETDHSVALSLIHICRCRRLLTCRSRWSPYH